MDAKEGQVQVKRVVCAQDMGVVINPEGAKHADGRLHHDGPGLFASPRKCISKAARFSTRNFDTYDLPRFSWLPKIETVIIENKENPPRAAANRRSS